MMEQRPSAAIGLMLSIAAHGGWPSPEGGAQRLSDAMAQYFLSLGGTIRTGAHSPSVGGGDPWTRIV